MPREEMETWLTSFLLGELSEGESAAVRELIKHDPELAKLHEELKSTIQLVREASASAAEPTAGTPDQPKLSSARREKLLAQFKTVAPKEFAPEKRRTGIRLLELAAVLAILALLAAILLPSLAKSKSKAQSITVLNNLRQLEMAKEQWAQENKSSGNVTPTFDDLKPYLGRGEMPSVAGETYVLGAVGEPPSAEIAADDAKKTFKRFASTLPSGESSDRVRLSANGQMHWADTPPPNTTPVFGTKPESENLFSRAPRAAGSLASKSTGNAPAQNLSYYGSSAGAQSYSVSTPSAATPPPATPIVLPVTDSDSANQNFNVMASVANPTYAPGVVPVPGRPGELVGQSLAAGSLTPIAVSPSSGATKSAPIIASTGLPATAATTDGATPKLEIREYAVNSEALHRAIGTESPSDEANRRRYSTDPGLQTIPRVSVVDQVQGGGGGGGGGASATPIPTPSAVSETTLNNGSDSLSDTAGVKLKAHEDNSVSVSGVAQVRGITLDGVDKFEASNASPPFTTNDVLSLDKLREALKNSGQYDSQKYYRMLSQSGDDVGKPSTNSVNLAFQNKPASGEPVSQPLMGAEPLERSEGRGQLEGLKNLTKSQPKRTLAERSDDSQLRETTLGVKVAEEKLARPQKDLAVSATEVEQAQKQVTELKEKAEIAKADTRIYLAKKRELDDMVDYQRLLTRKLNLEAIDERLPKSAQVEVVERAEAKSEPRQTFWGGMRTAVSGEVERAARIKVDRDKPDVEDLNAASPRSVNPYDPHFLQSEFEIIRSETILNRVVDQLGLGKDNSNKSEAVALLRKRLDLQLVPNTTLVEIRAKADKPEEAANIANTVAEVYKQWRLDKGNELMKGGLASLEEHSRVQEEKIRKAKVELAQLGRSLGISDAEASGLTPEAAKELADLPIRKPSTNAPIPQPEIQTSENNFSTFSLNVSDVSFKLAAASLEKGQMPDPASVRSEEFINAFDYRDLEPTAGAPIGFAYERARYPFAHNRDLLRFSLKTAAAGRQSGRALNLVLLLDNSGSMERADRVRIIREALHVLAGQLQPQDKLSVITFARTPRLVADGISGDQAGSVTEAVSGLTPEGGTNLEEAMNLGYQTAARHYVIGGINRVVVLTDGAANLGDVKPESLKQKVEDARKQGIALDCFGIGWEGYNDDLLEVLSRNGDGRYGFINSPEEAASEFAGQLAGALKVAASDVKVQVEFNPRRVTSYRQIGYAKHQLTKEQFRDNTVDAAEIAAQEAGNALYTVEVNPAGDGPLCTVRVRFKIPGTTDYREQAWDVPFTGNALSLEQSSPAMRLAASAAAFSEWLVASPFAGDVSPDAVLNVLRGVPEVFGADSRPKTLEWMIRQAKSIEGK